MIDPNKVTEAVSEFLQNPTWNEIFTNAPGGAMERLAISFYFSKHHDNFAPEDFEDYRNLRDEIDKSLDEEDLQYLIDNNDKPEATKHYQELLDKLQSNGGNPTGQIRFEELEKNTESENGAEEQEATVTTEEEPNNGDGSEGGTEEETETETAEESSAEEESEEQTEGKVEEEEKTEDGEKEEDDKLNTALSVALNYLQNEEKQIGGEASDEKKK